MADKQQKEALDYFRKHAGDWRDKATSTDERKVNIIQQRNGYVLKVVKERGKTQFALDVGCGTGELVCDLARLGIQAVGVDFAQEMVDIAVERAHREGLDNARFVCSSIFDYHLPASSFDVIAANGFIEYISLEQLDRFLDLVLHALGAGGSFVFGSRNRLFNIFSLNKFTAEEMETGSALLLIKEALALASGADMTALGEMEAAPLQSPAMLHPVTGVSVSTRYQYTPAQLIKRLRRKGFLVEEVFPAHIHGVAPAFKEQHPEVHTSISNLLQNYAGEHLSLVPFASTFMMHAKKEG